MIEILVFIDPNPLRALIVIAVVASMAILSIGISIKSKKTPK